MKTHSGLVLLPAIAAMLAGCERQEPVQNLPEVAELVVITPHAAGIRDAFGQRFSIWHEDKYGHPVSIRWVYRGTVEAQRFIYDKFEQYPEAGGARQIGVDVFFGGGLPIHQDVAARGYAQPVKVPAEVLHGIPKELNGQPLYSPEGLWHGTALGGFGILFNRAAAESRGIPAPADWADLAGPAWAGWVAAADPSLSGSTAEILVLVLLRHGWEEGWGVATGILANCNGLLPSSGLIAPNVTAGVAVAGLQAEFVARMAVAAASETLAYVNPPQTVITPDPVTVLRGAPHTQAAARFVEFILSPEGQVLWALPADQGGPVGEALYRYPIRPEIYTQYADKLVVKGSPFDAGVAMKIDPQAESAYTKLLPHLLKAACGSNHLLLQKAWRLALQKGPGSPEMVGLREPPFPSDQAYALADECARDPRRGAELEAEWTQFFRARYAKVLGIAASAPADK